MAEAGDLGRNSTAGAVDVSAAQSARRATATATLEEVDIREELLSRPVRKPDYESEDRAFAALASEMAENPRNMLQKLVEMAVELCHADTAGISLLEGDVFRWEAVAGVFASSRNGTMPRAASPCGVCIERDTTQLMHLADRCFPALRAEPPFVEALLVPFRVQGQPVGTVWIVAHQCDRKFDRSDERVVRILSDFASAGWQLWKASKAAEEANCRKDSFLAVLGHELRNPLGAIVSASDLMMKMPLEGACARAVAVVARQGRHLTRLVDDMLDLSRIGEGKLELKKQRVELRAVVDDAVEIARASIERNTHELSQALPAEPIWLEADPERLGQLLSNLLINAAKYTPAGGRIRLSAERRDGQVLISVQDNGIGIAREQLDGIFNMFEQLGTSVERSGGGLGIGLALVRRLAEMHGGSVVSMSAGIGKGSQFEVRLPAASGAL
jgi:signal transduction histidine kinase